MQEKRKHERFKTPEGLLVFACGNMGRVIDISRKGLSLMFLDAKVNTLPTELSFDLFCTEKLIKARQIPGKIAWEKDEAFSAISGISYKTIGVQFDDLSPLQQDLLNVLLVNCIAGTA